jgi:hypothetical protein
MDHEPVVLGVRTDPEPDEILSVLHRQRAVMNTYTS